MRSNEMSARARACDLYDEARVVSRTLDLLGVPVYGDAEK